MGAHERSGRKTRADASSSTGNNAIIVEPDADLDLAIRGVAFGDAGLDNAVLRPVGSSASSIARSPIGWSLQAGPHR